MMIRVLILVNIWNKEQYLMKLFLLPFISVDVRILILVRLTFCKGTIYCNKMRKTFIVKLIYLSNIMLGKTVLILILILIIYDSLRFFYFNLYLSWWRNMNFWPFSSFAMSYWKWKMYWPHCKNDLLIKELSYAYCCCNKFLC